MLTLTNRRHLILPTADRLLFTVYCLLAAASDQRLGLAASLIELGEETEALAVLTAGFDGSAYTDVPAALMRAQLFEKRGEREKAIRAYSRVVELWQEADPELLPQREVAERALARLTARG